MTALETALRYYQAGAFARVVDLLQPTYRSSTFDPDVTLLLAVSLARLRRVDEAVGLFRRLLAEDPDCYEAHTWMATLLKNRQGIDEAIACAKRAIELRPDEAPGYGVLGGCYLYLRQPDRAVEPYSKALSLAPDVAENHHNLALAYRMMQRHREAVELFQRAIDLAPRAVQSYIALSGEYSGYGHVGLAIECLQRGLERIPNSEVLHSALAAAYTMIRNDKAAELHHKQAMRISPKARDAYAAWLLTQGRFDEANAIYDAMLAESPHQGAAYYGIMQSRKLTECDGDLAFLRRMESVLENQPLGALSELHLRYAVAKGNEQLKRFEQAMFHYDRANDLAYQIHNAGSPMDLAQLVAEHERVRDRWHSLETLPRSRNESSVPIFIVGMIRSGTTLLEQIVSSHGLVAPAGELRFWIEEATRFVDPESAPSIEALSALADEYIEYIELLAGKSERITDKMPLNFAYAGIIHKALPNARFLHIRRHPVDTCLSIYTTYFGQGPIFAYCKANIVAYYRLYEKTMSFWREVLPPDRLLEIDYEDLIGSPETVIPQIVSFCGLPWDDACLHHEQNDSAISTPSRWQARQPMYRTSMDRWKRYEPWLGEFGDLLQPDSRRHTSNASPPSSGVS